MEYALGYLSRYPKTEQEMKIILMKKGYDGETTQKTMENLKRNDFINDEKFAESFFYGEVVKKGKPVYNIKQKLLQRGIEKSAIESYIAQHEEEIAQGISEGIEREIATYKKKGVEGFDIIQKLMRKGHRLQDIKSVIQKKQEEGGE